MFEFFESKEFLKYKQEKIFAKIKEQIKTLAIYKGGGGLGDLVVANPLFASFKKAFPDAKIMYLGTVYPRFKKIFKAIKAIDGYIDFKRPDRGKSKKEYLEFRKNNLGKIDLLIDTQRRWETSFWLKKLNPRYMLSASVFLSDWKMPRLNYKKMHILEQMLSLPARLGINNFSQWGDADCSLNIDSEYKENAAKILKGYKGKFMALMPSCGMQFKNWMPENFAKLGDLFANYGYMVIILGSPQELNLYKQIAANMKQRSIIPGLIDLEFAQELMNDAAILKQCEIAVGNDSGGMHLASCLGSLCATVFGPTTPRKFAPIGPRNIVFYENMQCSPCRFKCSRKIERECLRRITPEQVFTACINKLKSQKED
ncbi:MAG: glycosyltransferase family 9 protein [Candidatus Omnitrophota bacterium]